MVNGNVDIYGTNGYLTEIANSSSGTTLNKLAKLTGAPSKAITVVTSDTGGVIGIVVGGAGTTGNAQIAVEGQVSCVFDSTATVAGDYVQISSSTAGDCYDAGSTYPSSGQVIGRVMSTNSAGGGTYAIEIQPELRGASSLSWPLAGASDSVSAPDYAWSGHTTTGLYYNSGIGFAVGGTNIATITSTGIGIGTPTPTANLQVRAQTNGEFSVRSNQVTSPGVQIASVNDAYSGYEPLEIAGSSIDFTNGNVGIGTATPRAQLEINGSDNTTTATVLPYFLNSANTSVYVDSSLNYAALGTSTPGNNREIAGVDYAYVTPTQNIGNNIVGRSSLVEWSGTSYTSQALVGNQSGAYALGSGNILNISGSTGYGYYGGSATTTLLSGMQAFAENVGTGTITTQYGVKVTLANNGGGTITNGYGVYISGAGAGTNTNTAYDFYAADSSANNYFAGNVGIGSSSPAAVLDLSQNTGALAHAAGTTAQRPSTLINGMQRYNSTTTTMEGYVAGGWIPLQSVQSPVTTTVTLGASCSNVGQLARDSSNDLVVCQNSTTSPSGTNCSSVGIGAVTFDIYGATYLCMN
jgi:hypothetical protein